MPSDCSAYSFQVGVLPGLGGPLTYVSQIATQPKAQSDLCRSPASFLSAAASSLVLFPHEFQTPGLHEFQPLSSQHSETSRVTVDSPSLYCSLGFILTVSSGTCRAHFVSHLSGSTVLWSCCSVSEGCCFIYFVQFFSCLKQERLFFNPCLISIMSGSRSFATLLNSFIMCPCFHVFIPFKIWDHQWLPVKPHYFTRTHCLFSTLVGINYSLAVRVLLFRIPCKILLNLIYHKCMAQVPHATAARCKGE